VLVVLGILVSVYLTISKYDTSVLACPSTGVINCESVITSQYSTIFGIPLSVLGIILFVLAPIMLFKGDDWQFLWALAGGAAILYSLASQALLSEVCIYCLLTDLLIAATIYATYANPKPKAPPVKGAPTPANPTTTTTTHS
jgi:uncharacterized membrane protein